jgi:hypothetical protein
MGDVIDLSEYLSDEPPQPPRSFKAPERDPGAPALLDLEGFGLAGEIVAALEPYTEADRSAMLFDLLTSFGSAVGPQPHGYAGNERHGLKLYAVTVGDTSAGRKGTARAVMRQVLDVAAPVWSDTHVGSGLSSGEGLAQALSELAEPRTFMAVETEFGRVLSVAARRDQTIVDVARQLWDGSHVATLNRKATVVNGAHFSLLGHITRDELREKLQTVDIRNGFANRIVWTYAQRPRLIPGGARLPQGLLSAVALPLSEAIDAASELHEIRRTAKAERLWERWYLKSSTWRFGGPLGFVVERREAQCFRLQMIFAALDGSKWIREHHVRAAAKAWRYCEETAAYIWGATTGDRRADKVLYTLTKRKRMKRSVIRSEVLGDNVSRDELDGIRDLLHEEGLIKAEKVAPKSGRRARPAEVWTYLGDTR